MPLKNLTHPREVYEAGPIFNYTVVNWW